MFREEVKGFGIPDPFFTKDNRLYRVNRKNDEEEFISRHVPYVTKCFDDIEKNNVQYELKWFHEGKVYSEVVPAIALATKREVISLANKGFSSNDRNARHLIEYFDLFLTINGVRKSMVVSRLGYLGDHLIHPLLETKYRVVAPGEGEQERLNAFKELGTARRWVDSIFAPFRLNAEGAFAIASSFASVLFKEFNLSPIVVDISGSSTNGKTTVQKACASVWGVPKDYMGTMSATKVGIERLAGFLNAFPLILDDTNTSDKPHEFQNMIYQFANGKGKLRGNIEGSRAISGWQSVFITTGENNILEYTNSQGAAARVIPITNFNTDNIDSKYFETYDDDVEQICGAIGVEFIKRWNMKKEQYKHRFELLERQYKEAASTNRILKRIARPFSFIVFVAEVLNDLFNDEGMDMPVDDFPELFLTICAENSHADRPRNVLIEILEELDANRSHIFDEYEPTNGTHAIVNKEGLFLTVNYVKQKLGSDAKQIREAWMKQQLTIQQKNKGKIVDYKVVRHKKRSQRAIHVNQELLEEQGFDFSRNSF
ncbi:DUF927 domain-containing protein [Siminovitchia sp. FSL H7-0308]|uniref:DUF927 domain-containing protein n=1 Tax=Siminovitchia sp. FSL H7-0308 TaxID=2921432 RepID=UPI0030EBA8A7